MNGKLILEDGSSFCGTLLGDKTTVGEVVFNTGMTGYQEVLTDPSYCGQIVTMTYPLIGNYGVAQIFDQSRRPYVKGFIISELCGKPSSWQMEGTLTNYLQTNDIVCIYNVDTRAVTRKIRNHGTMKGIIVPENASAEQIEQLLAVPAEVDTVRQVTTDKVYRMPADGPRIAVMDFGIKQNILNSLSRQGFDLTVVPAFTSAQQVLEMNPDGIFLSNGPGDPKDVPEVIAAVKELLDKRPIFGICLGHQLLALAMGGNTYKLKFGHRGTNQPVKNLERNRVYITSQNHGYAVEEESLAGLNVQVTHRAVNDGTVEGMRHNELPIFSVQYHPEAAPGPDDNTYLFEEFMNLLERGV